MNKFLVIVLVLAASVGIPTSTASAQDGLSCGLPESDAPAIEIVDALFHQLPTGFGFESVQWVAIEIDKLVHRYGI